jgi:hypothetical protein
MTLSADLQRVYASAPVNTTWYDALYLTHPAWSTPVAFITNSIEPRIFNLNGQPVEFTPATFTVQLPRRDDLGIVDFEITFPLTARVFSLIDLAEPSDDPISATLTTYLDTSADPQMEPITLQLDNVSLGVESGTGRAQRIDLLNRTYPRNIVRPLYYPGLWR